MDLSSAALHILEENKTTIFNYLDKVLNEYFSGSGKDKLLRLSEVIKKDQLKMSSLTDLLNLFSKRIYSSGYEEKIVDEIIDAAIKMCRDKKFQELIYKVLMDLKEEKCDNFLSRLSFDFLEKTDTVNLQNAAVNFHQEVIEELFNMKNRDNKFRQILKKEIFQTLLGIEYSRDKIESAKEKIIDSIDAQKIVEQITEVRDGASLLSKFIVKKAQMYFDEITQDNVLKQHLDNVIKYALIKFTVRNHSFIGNLVSETLNNYDDKKLNGFIEDKFGEDLQWIRINGSSSSASMFSVLVTK